MDVDLQRGHNGDGCLTSSILFKYERSSGHLSVLSCARVRRVARESVVLCVIWQLYLCCVVGC